MVAHPEGFAVGQVPRVSGGIKRAHYAAIDVEFEPGSRVALDRDGDVMDRAAQVRADRAVDRIVAALRVAEMEQDLAVDQAKLVAAARRVRRGVALIDDGRDAVIPAGIGIQLSNIECQSQLVVAWFEPGTGSWS